MIYTQLKKITTWPLPWFAIGITGVFLLSLTLHFWRLTEFNSLVFDEIYYAKFAVNYLQGVAFFDAHPPLGKYLIALGIWLGDRLDFNNDIQNNLTGMLLTPFQYRWLNAITGSLICLIVAGISYQLTKRRSHSLIAAFFVSLDGLLLVESRLALINIYLIFFGLLGHWFFLLALDKRHQRWFWLPIAGICCGACLAVKWNGLGFLLGIYLLWLGAWLMHWITLINQKIVNNMTLSSKNIKSKFSIPLQQITQIKLLPMLFNFGVIPALVYYIIWLPHLSLDRNTSFWEVHQQIFNFHKSMGNGANVHTYCSAWYTWPLMIRPILYFYETAINTTDPVPIYPPLPANVGKIIYAVQAMGNPVLWWTGTVAVILLAIALFGVLLSNLKNWLNTTPINRLNSPNFNSPKISPANLCIALYLFINYGVNFFPWIIVTRCTFIYLYMPASIFVFLSLAWLVDSWLRSHKNEQKQMAINLIILILLSFIFWSPVYLGLPLSHIEHLMRLWLPSWL